ncbi:MAG: ice-binding family protein [bacterium]
MNTERSTIPSTTTHMWQLANTRRPSHAAPQATIQILACLALALAVLAPCQTLQAASPAPVSLRSCAGFTILGATAVSTDGGGGIINGDVGLSPGAGSAITALTAAQVKGTIYAVDVSGPAGSVMAPALLTTAQGDLTSAYIDAAGRSLARITVSGNIGGTTLAPGLYLSSSSIQITGDLTLDAGGDPNAVWIFQMGTTLTTAAGSTPADKPGNSRVILAGGAQAKNVFWQVGSSATLGAYSVFKGTIMANVSITMGVGAITEGRALARTGAVTFNGGGSGSLPNNGPLTIVSAHGIGLLPVGVYTNRYGTTLTNRVTGVETSGGTQYVAKGWSMTGNGPTSGSATNMTMVQTNTATLVWVWGTNYLLNTSAAPNGTLTGSTNGWYLAGSNVTVTAVPDFGYSFAGWTGNVSGPTNNAIQKMTMNQARTAMASFVEGTAQTLTIVSDHGTGDPLAGLYVTANGDSLTNSISGEETLGGTQYVATGWSMIGNDPVAGIDTNMVMVQTNTAVLTWLWTTNYALDASSDANGSLTGSTNGWYLAGSSVTVTAAPNSGYFFAGWTGDVTGPANDEVQTLIMDQARTAMAHFVPGPSVELILTIVSEHGTGAPPAGGYANGGISTRTNSMTDVEAIGGTQYVATGWSMTGNDPVAGMDTNMIMVQTNNAVLTWLWNTNYWLVVGTNGSGSVTPTNGWNAAGASVLLTATPGIVGSPVGWSGDTNGCLVVGATLLVPMTQARSITAIFASSGGPAICGKVTKPTSCKSAGVAGVLISVSGGGTALTDACGNYTCAVPMGWSGIVTPTLDASGTFAPTSRSYTNVIARITGQNYIWTPPPSISGKVTKFGTCTGVANVILVFSGVGVATTTVSGTYCMNVTNNWSGTVTPSNAAGGLFSPTSKSFSKVIADKACQNFIWTPPPSISGTVTKFGTCTGVTNVILNFSGVGAATTTVSGTYCMTVPYNWTGTVTPSNAAGGVFSPTSKSFSKVIANKTSQNFIWTPPPSISGKVTKPGSSTGVANVILNFSGVGAATTTVSGTYCMTVPYNWTGTVTPSNAAGGVFSPTSKSFSKVIANKTSQNFIWTPPPSISGKVTKPGSSTGVANVILNFSGVVSATTTVSGAYCSIPT